MTIDQLLSYYQQGALTQAGFFVEIVKLLTSDNINEVLRSVPPELRGYIRQIVFQIAVSGGAVIASNFSQEATRNSQEKLAKAIPALRDWLRTHDSELEGNGSPAATAGFPAPEPAHDAH